MKHVKNKQDGLYHLDPRRSQPSCYHGGGQTLDDYGDALRRQRLKRLGSEIESEVSRTKDWAILAPLIS